MYITGLPLDATEAELVKVFSKCGVIKLDDDRRPRVRVYRCTVLTLAARSAMQHCNGSKACKKVSCICQHA